ncbi:MAG TPA: hypothetical protein VEY12_06840 [Thermoplasmata archaeon]|nr:hypothetical protein [Thermoplasmata archaeon]
MESDRVRAVLEGIESHQEAAASQEQRDLLVTQGLVRTVDGATHDRWNADVAGLVALRDRVRDLSRQALATPGPDASPELRQMIANLEQLAREKATLDGLVWNGPTQEYVDVTLSGKGVLEDLKAWQRRLPGRDFVAFQEEMAKYRGQIASLVDQASVINKFLILDEQTRTEDEWGPTSPMTNVDARFASAILAKRGINPGMIVSEFQWFNHGMNWGDFSPEDRLLASAILASLPWDPSVVRSVFERIRIGLQYHGIMPQDRVIVAASLADLQEGWWDQVFARIDDIKRRRPALNALLVAALARSPYSVDEAMARFDAAQSAMTAKGYQDGMQLDIAASLLAASQIPSDTLVDRFSHTLSHVQGSFDPPFAPAAMLATNPLEPDEAVDVFRDCLGAVTRMSFFDLTLEIEELALILSYGLAPLGMGYLGGNLPAGATIPPAAVAAAPMAALGLGLSWYVWHNYFVYRPIGRYIATHPVHVHTVAAFG